MIRAGYNLMKKTGTFTRAKLTLNSNTTMTFTNYCILSKQASKQASKNKTKQTNKHTNNWVMMKQYRRDNTAETWSIRWLSWKLAYL